MITDNAKFHIKKNILISDNITLINILPYISKLNPCERVWQFMKRAIRTKHLQNI